jgi:dUTP pyrophosphatase
MKIKLLDKNCLPFKKYITDTGYDLKARLDKMVSLSQHSTMVIPSGICIDIPKGFEGQVRPRSSLFQRGINVNGTIDSGYTAEIGIIITNTSDTPFIINPYDRIAQLVICPIELVELEIVDTLSETERSDSGFGSTGTN